MRCIFCKEDGILTREHVLPDWLKVLYPEKSRVTNKFTSETSKIWPSKIFQHKVKIVCAECNHGWMAELENQVKPIISQMVRLEDFLIDENKQNLLAFWSQKTVLMLNQSVPGGIKFTQDLFDDIYQKKNFSNKVLVNLGWRMKYAGDINEPICFFETKQIPYVSVAREIHEHAKKEREAGRFAWRSIFVIGPIVFELVGHNMKVRLEVVPNTNVFKCIRPFNTDLQWPLDFPIEAEGGLGVVASRG